MDTTRNRSVTHAAHLLAALDVAACVTDFTGRIQFATWPAAKILGLTPESLEHRRLDEVLPLAQVKPGSYTLRLQGQTDRARVVHILVRELSDEPGNRTGFAVRFDESLAPHSDPAMCSGQQGQALRQANVMAKSIRAGQLACIGELAAGVAHEINNPVNGMINYAQILLDRGQLGPEDTPLARQIIVEGERIAEIVANLLFFARQRRQEKCPLIIGDVVLSALALLRSQLNKDCITLHVVLPEELPLVYGRDRELRQVFLNLLSNARYALNQKFPGLHPRKRIDIEARCIKRMNGTRVLVSVTDRGTGIPASIMRDITTPFFSTKPEREGTGLGLSLSEEIIADHAGTLELFSEEHEFTRVELTFPIFSLSSES